MAIVEIKIPSPGESINQVELFQWLVKEGDVVTQNSELAELESDKATLSLIADVSGKISLKAEAGDTVDVGAVACTIDTSFTPKVKESLAQKPTSTQEKEVKKEPVKPSVETPKLNDDKKIKTTPLARKIMEENNLSIDDVVNGLRRLTRSDVEMAMSSSASASETIGNFKKPISRETQSKKMSSLRRKLSERLVSVKNETAMLTTFNEVDMKPVMDLRKKYQKQFIDTHGIKLGLMSFFIKASAIALQEFPNVNAMIDEENIVSYNYADISVAVSTPKGLMVPVIRNVENLGLAQIEKELSQLAQKARQGKLSIPEMTGGTFTITNGGVFGSMLSTPIINPPQSAILGMHNIVERPVALDGQVVVRPIMYVALSYDHRIIDGRESVGFLVKMKQLLENPKEMLFGTSNAEKVLLEIG